MKFNLKNISNSRPFLFGIATLMILFFHSTIEISNTENIFFKIIAFIKKCGNTGVDIFLFLSAIGLYFSMSKESNVKKFYFKRIVRILPALLFVNLLWFAYKDTTGIKNYFLEVTGLAIFVNGSRTCWYFTLLILLYFIYPFLYKLEKKWGTKVYIFAIILIIAMNYFISIKSPLLFKYIEIALRRIPVFLIGCIFSKYIYNGIEINKKYLIFIFLIMIGCIYIFYNIKAISIGNQIWRYVGGILAVSLVFIISYLYQYIKNVKLIEWIGIYSMETYLLFEKFLIIFKPIMKAQDTYNLIFNFSILIITILASIYLRKITDTISNNLLHKEIKE